MGGEQIVTLEEGVAAQRVELGQVLREEVLTVSERLQVRENAPPTQPPHCISL